MARGGSNQGRIKEPLGPPSPLFHTYISPATAATMPTPTHLHQPRDIVRIRASVKQALRTFFTDNSRLGRVPITPKTSKSNESTTSTPDTSPSPTCGVVRPGVVLALSSGYATVALFTTLSGTGLSGVEGRLRHLFVPIRPVNQKHDAALSNCPYSFAIHPTWPLTGVAKYTLCLCLKYKVPINQLKPWNRNGKPRTAGEKSRMCKVDFRRLLQLCKENSGL